MASTYNKPFLSLDAQIDLLAERGLIIDDRDAAHRELQAIGYYRLSGYWYPFRKPAPSPEAQRPSEFIEGSNLREVLQIYEFDMQLRKEILYAIARIEVALRFSVGHTLGRRGPFAHYDETLLDSDWSRPKHRNCKGPNCTSSCAWVTSDREDWAAKQRHNEEISNEAFMAHFQSNYDKPLPVWTATEVMTFGDLVRLFNGMTQRDRQHIALDYDLHLPDGNGDAGTMANWLEHLRQTRNYCAHHARLWNRNHTAPLAAPPGSPELAHLRGVISNDEGALMIPRPVRRIYGTIAVLTYLLLRIDNTSAIRDGLIQMIDNFCQESPTRYSDMGFPQNWRSLAIWQTSYARDRDIVKRSQLLRNVELLASSDAAVRLWSKPTYKEQRSLLNYYRKNGAALSVPGAEAHRYPSFQFNALDGDLHASVITANRHLLQGDAGSEGERWAALEWWVTPNALLPGSSSPLELLRNDGQSAELLAAALPSVKERRGNSSTRPH